MDGLVAANIEHGECLTCRTEDERPLDENKASVRSIIDHSRQMIIQTNLSSGLFNTEHQCQGCEDNLDYTINTCSEKAGRRTGETNALENLSGKVSHPRSKKKKKRR